jgi:hypothetical protein
MITDAEQRHFSDREYQQIAAGIAERTRQRDDEGARENAIRLYDWLREEERKRVTCKAVSQARGACTIVAILCLV